MIIGLVPRLLIIAVIGVSSVLKASPIIGFNITDLGEPYNYFQHKVQKKHLHSLPSMKLKN